MYNINKEMMNEYINRYSQVDFNIGVDRLLSDWHRAKAPRLLEIFNGELILEREVVIEKSVEEMANIMDDGYFDLQHTLYYALTSFDISWRERNDAMNLFDPMALASNRVTFPFTITINGKVIKISEGQKTIKAIATICKALGIKDEDFENFRNAHSLVLNDKKTSGILCLSIHPFDYITMSHNIHGWNSCMDWTEDGCYRAGTLEMINCPNTIVAYLKTEGKNITFNGYEWNSKKWRELVSITRDVILANRSYPYHNQELTNIVIDWIRELVPNYYRDEKADREELRKTEEFFVSVHTNMMYNDAESGNHKITITRAKELTASRVYVEVGGLGTCLTCGGAQDMTDRLCCLHCSGENYCEHCEEYCNGEMYYIDSIEAHVCEYCYYEYYERCEGCGDRFRNDEVNYINTEVDVNKHFPESGNYCPCCIRHFRSIEEVTPVTNLSDNTCPF